MGTFAENDPFLAQREAEQESQYRKWEEENMYEDRPILKRGDLHIVGAQFGIRFVEGCSNGCCELYGEDDENYFLKDTFDIIWLKDLEKVIQKAIMYKSQKLKEIEAVKITEKYSKPIKPKKESRRAAPKKKNGKVVKARKTRRGW